MNVWEIYQLINTWINKDQSGRSFTVEQFNIALQAIDIDFLKLKYGLPEDYKPGQPIPRQAWQVTQKITDDLRHLKVILGGRGNPLLKVDTDGYANIPEDYIHYSSLRYDKTVNSECGETNEETSVVIEELVDDKFDARLQSKIKKPYTKYPICRFNNDHIEFRPKNIRFVIISYIRMPIPGILVCTEDSNNDLVYDPINSRQIEWPADMHTDVANRIYLWLSVSIQNQLSAQAANARKNEGQ